jgi:membrane protein required for colicin V production
MSFPDIVILLILLIFAFGGLRRGFVMEMLTTIGLALGFGLVYYFRADIMDLALRLLPVGWQRQWGITLIFLFFFMAVYLGFATLGKHLAEALHKTPLKWPDRILGIAGGVIKGAFLLGLLVMAIEWMGSPVHVRNWLWHSEIVRWGKREAVNLLHWESAERRKWVCVDPDRGS